MKAKKFFAPTMQQALKKVTEQMGPDAVVLANRKVNGGVEVITALDYDPKHDGKVDFDNFDQYSSSSSASTQRKRIVNPELEAELRRTSQTVSRGRYSDLSDDLIGLNERLENSSLEDSFDRGESPFKKKASILRSKFTKATPKPTDELNSMKQEILGLKQMLKQQLDDREMADYASYHPLHAAVLKRLTQLGLSQALARHIVDRVSEMHDEQAIWREALTLLADDLPVAKSDLLERGGVYAFFGPSGSGKTTTIAKLVAKFALKHGSEGIVLISTDGQRIGAHDQMRTLGRILNVPVRIVDKKHSLEVLLNTVRNKNLVIIDTPGVDPSTSSIHQQLRVIKQGAANFKAFLTLPCTANKSVLSRILDNYQDFSLNGCILTKIDETGSLGEMLSILVERVMPVSFITNGPRIPDDIEHANAGNLVSKAVYMYQQLNGGVSVFNSDLRHAEEALSDLRIA
ncbi:flagellar biosynthesis protein FlhF [Litoribrevibacter albus]|uniref:Flagellar biosynthesis protein FlhF n=1 Tax=Litoribrevibacter albus TaxID=1473156 RepID=A0AA37W8E7_9GAMM|nr:flagellar biosynthesis protein FlhF [Litoribrevibacter albus]GLQ32353.1 flagellar biosynthesis protein FlhF [Litoribrevibacter albus]